MTPGKSARVVFVGLLLAGAAARVVAAWYSWGGWYPDEHQQYLEQAHRLAFGFGRTFWEQKYGMRSEVYPWALAVGLRGLAAVGVNDPVARAAVLRGAVALTVYAALAWVAWDRFRAGRPVWGLVYLGLAGLSPAVVCITVRFQTETVMMAPLAAGMVLFPRRPFWAGVLFGLMFAVRFPSAFLIIGFGLVALIEDWRAGRLRRAAVLSGRAARLTAGTLLGTTLFVGAADWLMFGAPFHSAVEHFRQNVLLGKAAQFGVEPWWFYLLYHGVELLILSVLAPVLVPLGAVREWRWAVPFAVFVFGHSLLGHKEERFLWGGAVLTVGLIAGGVEAVYGWAVARRRGDLAIVGAILASSPALAVLAYERVWTRPEYRATAEGLRVVGRLPDATGVGFPVPVEVAGNYFFLGRNIPLEAPQASPDPDVTEPDLTEWTARVRDPARGINYIIAPPPVADRFAGLNPTPVATVYAGWVVYRLNHPGR